MIPIQTAIAIGVGTLMVIVIVVSLMTGSIFAAAVVVALVILLGVVLIQYGFLKVKVEGNEVAFLLFEAPVAPAAAPKLPELRPLESKEVFHVSDNRFTYDDAPAVCAAYESEIATQEQVQQAYDKGAEWCGYGWSAGGLALFPTQKATWEQLQTEVDPAKRTACGRPGVNGGYFDPTLKFGVNCYGKKPKGDAKLPAPPPGSDPTDFKRRTQTFKDQISSFLLTPFNRTQWSSYGTQFSKTADSLGTESSVNPHPPTVSAGGGAPGPSSTSAGLIFKAVQAP